MPLSGASACFRPSSVAVPVPRITYSTSSEASLRNDAQPFSSRTRSEIARAPPSRPKCLRMRSAPCRTGFPSSSSVTRQPPSSRMAISWDYRPFMERKEDGIRATNQDFIRYDQVEKRQTYHLAETAEDDPFDDDFVIRTCDIGRFLNGDEGGKRAFATELGEALSEIGFAILEGHGVDPALYDQSNERVAELFTRLSLEQSMRFRAERFGSVNQGYFPIKETSNMHPDLVEGWVFCRRAFESPAVFWPLQEFVPIFEKI